MCKNKIYKVKVDNVNNITSGSGLTRFGITLSQTLQSELQGKLCNVWVEYAQLITEFGGVVIATANVAIASSINQRFTYNNTLDDMTNILCYFPSERLIVDGTTSVLSIVNPTEKSYVGVLPNTIEFWLCSAVAQTTITLASANYTWVAVLCIQEIDGEE